MPQSTEVTAQLIEKFGGSHANSGSTEVQVALLTERIRYLTEHVKIHKKDHHSRRGLTLMVARRRRLLKYLRRRSVDKYLSLIKELELRG